MDLTICVKTAGLGKAAAALSNGAKLTAQAKSPLTPGERAQRPTVMAHTCFHAATLRGGRR